MVHGLYPNKAVQSPCPPSVPSSHSLEVMSQLTASRLFGLIAILGMDSTHGIYLPKHADGSFHLIRLEPFTSFSLVTA